ncbi:phage integrase-related [Anaeramoeba flamelloides]|uniref:Phage integrase-related n=1 Tax=Anaeramoeba flamelloides TaxID=1746091 RepID=A0ABQ8XT69_9EUKA|nr:phage integrase-related [Anaeramoeba flamelloides]
MFNGPKFYSFSDHSDNNKSPNEAPISDDSLEQLLKETIDQGIDVTEKDQVSNEVQTVDLQNTNSIVKISEEEKKVISRSQKIHENQNSRSSRKTVARKFQRFLKARNINKKLEEISLEDYDQLITLFIWELKKKNGEDFVFNSVRTYVNQLFAFFSVYWLNNKLKNPPTLTNCPYSCNFFHIKLSELSEQGKTGSHRMGLTMEEEADLLNSLDIENDEMDLLIAAFWMIGKFTGYRGGEIFNLMKKQVQFKESKLVGTYVETYLNHRKNQNNLMGFNVTSKNIRKIFHYPKEKHDPYQIIKKYSLLVTPKRPPNSRFWSAVNANSQRKYWYKNMNIGRGHLAKLFKDRIKRAGIDKPNVTFHSIRATVVTNFVRNNINDKQGKTFTGHISDQSYNVYKTQDEIQSKRFSKTLLPRYPKENEEEEKYQKKKKEKSQKKKEDHF